jgi:bifunctional DNA-binding transcriptional regulator/antitoxin component of YhaV-PrlF toxin-antitoxin module
MTTIAIDAAGRLEIPLEVRQQLGITDTQTLNLEVIDGQIILQPLNSVVQHPTVYRCGTALVLETPPLGDINDLIDNIREERIQCILPT